MRAILLGLVLVVACAGCPGPEKKKPPEKVTPPTTPVTTPAAETTSD